ncbi:DUF7576 family protein [Halostella salina]|uniref:DUF7576 family protein n=1 Tax=Halostella salina TaxID=1547897 RepID=UPI000EF77C48|nr:hypothetical protein [Halostella salina]
MNAENTQENRDVRSPSTPDTNTPRDRAAERVVNRSIRVLLDSNASHRCDHCGEEINEGTRYRNVTVRERPGEISDYAFCNEECLSAGFV